jgi:UDP-2,3-diacylglucosamine hydrolase
VPLRRQPFTCVCGDTELRLAHGDFNQPLKYRVYTGLIRNPVVMHVLRGIDRIGGGAIVSRLETYLERKDDCYVIGDFEALTRRHLAPLYLPEGSVFIEGHYHQGVAFDLDGVRYFNPAAFACNRHYAIVTYEAGVFDLSERRWEEV